MPDKQEQSERQEAARAYAKEDEKHFVDYVEDCIKHSRESKESIRESQAYLYSVYQEEEPAEYADKEEWQSTTVIPKPYATVTYAAATIKKAFSPNFLSIEDEMNPQAKFFWQRIMQWQLGQGRAAFTAEFIQALIMALAVGESMEMIPRYDSRRGLYFTLVEPWKIHRDPDAPPRDPQGGLFWIHQEWMDFFRLRQLEEAGKYFDVDRVKDTHEDASDPLMTKEAIASRKNQLWQRSDYRTMSLINEFWGVILDKKGEVLLDNATLTVAGGRVIEKPRIVPYNRLRWPGVSFSPQPDLLSWGGRSLIKGVTKLWEAMNNLFCLHEDSLKWLVLPPTEINVEALVDSEDVEDFPGHKYLVKETINGQEAIRPKYRRDYSNSILANMQFYDQSFQRGSMVTDAVQGLPGYRQDMTYRESAMLLDQSMGGFSLMGENVENGAIWAVQAARDVIESFAAPEDYLRLFSEEEIMEYQLRIGSDPEGNILGLPEMSGRFHVSGVQALLKDAETLSNLRQIVIPLAGDPKFGKYIRPYSALKAIEVRTNLKDEEVFVDEQTGRQIEAMEMQNAQQPPQPPAGPLGEPGQAPPVDTSILQKMAGGQ